MNTTITILELEKSDFEKEMNEKGLSFDYETAKGFDGLQYVEYIVNASTIGAVALFLKYWIEKRKFLKITYDGKEFHGYTKSEVEDLIKLINEVNKEKKE